MAITPKLGLCALLALPLSAIPAAAQSDLGCVNIVAQASSGERLTMDPALAVSSEDQNYHAAIYEQLVDVNADWQPVPRLATAWKSNENATEWTFTLREGVKFHDGTDFDADDVVYTYKRLLDPATGSAAAASLAFLDPDGIATVDAHTVRFTTKTPASELPTMIGTKETFIVPAGATHDTLSQHGMGTGPFVQETFTKGAPVNTLVRNPNYWDPGLPKAKCLNLSVVTESITRMAALVAGQIDLVLTLDPLSARTVEASKTAKTLKAPGGSALSLVMWVDKAPFDDLRVRQAMKMVVDRQAISDVAWLGMGTPANDNPIPITSSLAYRTDFKQRDVEGAKRLLAEAGHPDGLSIDLYTSTVPPGALEMAEAYVAMAADAGIKVNLINAPAATYWSETWLKVPFMTAGWAARAPAEALSVAYRKNSRWPETHWYRDDYEAILDKAIATIDAGQRIELYKKAQQLLSEEGGTIIPAIFSIVAGINAACSGYQPHPSVNIVDFRFISCNR